jgi:hypothetical protein
MNSMIPSTLNIFWIDPVMLEVEMKRRAGEEKTKAC